MWRCGSLQRLARQAKEEKELENDVLVEGSGHWELDSGDHFGGRTL